MINDNKSDKNPHLPKEIVEIQENIKQLQTFIQVKKTFTDIVVDAFNCEHLRLRIADRQLAVNAETRQEDRILNWVFGLYTGANFFTFFSDASMQKITEDISMNTALRGFTLNLVERVSSVVEAQGVDEREQFIDEIVRGIKNSKGKQSDSLLPETVSLSIELDSVNKLKVLFNNNQYLYILYTLVMNFHRVAIYADLVTPKTQQPTRNNQRQQ